MARRGWVLLPGALCALAAHAVAYRSFFPGGSAHRYLDWYEPVVGALSLAALGVLAALAALAVAGKRLPIPQPENLWARLAGSGVALFLLQEIVERAVTGGVEPPALPATTWLAVLAAVALAAGLLAVLARSGAELARLVLRRLAAPRACAAVARPRPVGDGRRRSPLAVRRGLRAPPLLPA